MNLSPPPFAPQRPSAPFRIASSPSAKIVVAGGSGVGKTTLVGSISELPPVGSEMALNSLSEGADYLRKFDRKTSTTVAMDFGRRTVSPELVLYLFGTPGQDRFSFMWDSVCHGARGAVLVVDTRRLESSFAPVDYLESRRIPFVVAVNRFPGSPGATPDEIRENLSLTASIPILNTDATNPAQVAVVLDSLVDLLKQRMATRARVSTPRRSELGRRGLGR